MSEDYEKLKRAVLELIEVHKEANIHVQVEARYGGPNRTWDHWEKHFGDTKVLKVGVKVPRDG